MIIIRCYFFFFLSPSCHSTFSLVRECVESDDGRDYRGHLNLTFNGMLCLPWTEVDSPLDESLFPDDVLSDASNYCRNPGGEQYLPSCPTASGVRWCAFVRCGEDGRNWAPEGRPGMSDVSPCNT